MKLLIDECLAPRAFKALAGLVNTLREPPQCVHLLERWPPGTLDPVWVPVIAKESGWIVVTCDNGRAPDRAPLDKLLPELKVTGLFLSPKAAQYSGFEKARMLLCVWPHLEPIVSVSPPGSRFRVERRGDSVRLFTWPMSGKPEPPPGQLF